MNIFITGTVGSGKSSFSKFLAKYLNSEFYEFIDLDIEAKKIIKNNNIEIPIDKTSLFSNQTELFNIEKKIWKLLKIPKSEKCLVIEASTFFESPKLFSKDDIIICVESDSFEKNVQFRDGKDRASLINKNQISKKIKSICADYVILNNENLESLEQKAKFLAENLNHQKTKEFEEELIFLKNEWRHNFPELPPKLFNDLIKQYRRIDRFYHNQSHLVYLLKSFNEYAKKHINVKLWKRAIVLAIFYHDSKMKFSINAENEFDSIEFLFNSFKENDLLSSSTNGARSYVTLAADLILATKNHKINDFITSSDVGAIYTKIFLDLDMLILSDENNFNDYEEGIRKEWMNFSNEAYNKGRSKILSDFIKEDIFQSEIFSDKNIIAKNLISQLIEKLGN